MGKSQTTATAVRPPRQPSNGDRKTVVAYIRLPRATSDRVDAFLSRWRRRTGIESLERTDALRQLITIGLDDEDEAARSERKSTGRRA